MIGAEKQIIEKVRFCYVVWTTWWLLQLHYVWYVRDNTITYNVEEIAYAYYIK